MIPIQYTIGDATRPYGMTPQKPATFDHIAHICNDAGGWGAGFVLALSARCSRPEDSYREWFAASQRKRALFERMKGRLGWERGGSNWNLEYPACLLELGQSQQVFDYADERNLIVHNMIAQRGARWTNNSSPLSYVHLWRCLVVLRESCKRDPSGRIAAAHMPRIGCGLGGGEWLMVEALIEGTLSKHNVPVFIYDQTQEDADHYEK